MYKEEHPIFCKSIEFIRNHLGTTGLDPLEQHVLERIIHSSGDFGIMPMLRFSFKACQKGVSAFQEGAPILTDTAMSAAAVQSIAKYTNTSVKTLLDLAPEKAPVGMTRSEIGMELAWKTLSSIYSGSQSPVVLIGSAPTALNVLLSLVEQGLPAPSLIIGMPVGFIGVAESKQRLARSGLSNIRLQGSRGGAGLVAAAANALLIASIDK